MLLMFSDVFHIEDGWEDDEKMCLGSGSYFIGRGVSSASPPTCWWWKTNGRNLHKVDELKLTSTEAALMWHYGHNQYSQKVSGDIMQQPISTHQIFHILSGLKPSVSSDVTQAVFVKLLSKLVHYTVLSPICMQLHTVL